jgi:uncharacterized Zn finger protein (UPF0148 family)
MTSYRRDPDTGAIYAAGGTYGIRGIDAERVRKEDWDAMLRRRAPEQLAARLPVSPSRRLAIEQQLGWTRAADGSVKCPVCQSDQRPDSSFCAHCGEPLIALEDYQGAQSGDTVACPSCGRMNDPSSVYCTGDGKLLPVASASPAAAAASARPRRAVRSSATRSRTGMLVAVEDFDFFDPYKGRNVHVTAGVTNCSRKAQAFLARPSAFL